MVFLGRHQQEFCVQSNPNFSVGGGEKDIIQPILEHATEYKVEPESYPCYISVFEVIFGGGRQRGFRRTLYCSVFTEQSSLTLARVSTAG